MAKKSTGRAYSKAQVEKQRRARGNAIRRAIFVVAVLAVVALAVIFLVLRGGEGASVGENAIGSAFSPLQNAFSSATKWVRDLFQGWRNYDELEANYQELFLENQQLSLELQSAEEALVENQRLLGLLDAQERYEELASDSNLVMDVETGAIRAMVNLRRDGSGALGETYNYAIGRAGDPGSVFKLTTLMTLLEDGKVTLDTEVPTFHGRWSWKGEKLPADTYLKDKGEYISVADGLKLSSNHVFRYLACMNYGEDIRQQKRLVDKLYEYKMNEKFDFDLEGLAEPVIPAPGSSRWSGTTLPSIAIGYSVLETPLHILMFYNGIANKGKLMKPYLVEAMERDGKKVKRMGPEVLNGSICSKATADTLVRALKLVVDEGTGRRLKSARCDIAGKTGTAQIPFVTETGGKARTVYKDRDGRKQHQGTFVGFFPADDPKYSAIVSVYSKLSTEDFYGGSIPAETFREIADDIYTLSPDWGNELKSRGDVPEMTTRGVISGEDNIEEVPDVKGLGLTDAIWSIENCGYRCIYEGTGHVIRQSPEAGSKARKGRTVKLTLR